MTLHLTIEFDTAVHHGSGYGIAGVIDRAILRDERAMPYLAGSALKGKFRFAASRWLRATEGERCGPPDEPWCKGEKICLLCQIFGSPRQPGLASFEDAYPAPPADAILCALIEHSRSRLLSGGSEIRWSTSIDRYSRRARQQRFFSTEVIPPLLRFQSQILGELTPEQTDCIITSARLLAHFGGDSSRGMGLCRYEIKAAS